MKLSTKAVGEIAIVSISGDIDAFTSGEIEEYLLATLEAGWNTLVIDFENVTFMSSIGLRVLLTVYQTAERAGTPVVIATLQSGVEKVLDTSGFSSFLKCYATVDDAMAVLVQGEKKSKDD